MKYRFERTYGTIEVGNISSRAAEVAFYLLLSLFPFLLFTISAVVFIPIILKIMILSIRIMQNMDGTDMTQDLPCQNIILIMRYQDIMYLRHG